MVETGTPTHVTSAIRDLAGRLGARADSNFSSVMLAQTGSMRDPPAGRWMDFKARQTIAIDRPAFTWKARTGPLRCITVVDALSNREGDLSVKLFGLLPIAHVRDNNEVNRGELMRYLAELPWAPDAILHKRELSWSITGDTRVAMTASDAAVEIELDAEGRIGSVSADRPRKQGTAFVTRPWRGRFFDYRQIDGRWIPHTGEVG